ncbi:sporulation-specific protein 15 [Euphorbia lathyris]|uniref:sporulation-specific protein 15 n=1 Tax=Euphorbia lathyris TaxID=212925 RepID=UPI00331350E5
MSRITKWKLEKTKVKVVFRLQFHATHIPQSGWDKLFISFIPADSGKVTAKTTKANVRNGTCKWGDPIYETTRLLQDLKTKQYEEKLYKLVVAMGTSRSSVLGEATINLADYADASKPSITVLPLHGSDSSTALHVTVQLLTSKTGFREFEQQRELRERGFQADHNTSDESSGRKVSSSEETMRDQMNKVNSRVRFSEKSKDLASVGEEVGLNEEYADSAVGFDGSSNTSESLYAEKQETSSNHEIDSLKSTASGDLAGSPQPDKADASDRRFSAHTTTDWVHGWNSDHSLDNELATANEENNRLRGSLEAAESSINELKLEVSSLQSHANEIGHEAQQFSKQLAAEMVSGEMLVKEVSILKSECSKLKDDLEQLKVTKLCPSIVSREAIGADQVHTLQDIMFRWTKGFLAMEDKIRELQNKTCFGYNERDLRFLHSDIEALLSILQNLKQGSGLAASDLNLPSEGGSLKDIREIVSHQNGQCAIGTGLDLDVYQPEFGMLHCLNLPGLMSHEPDAVDAANVMKGKIFELLRELDESKAERDCLAKKMDQMECYYEALVQELEENQRQILRELQTLRNEHSTCLYTVSSTKAEMESMHQDLNDQILRLAKEKHDLDSLNKELERRAVTSEAALKRARLNYSIAVEQLQKDLEVLSFQILSMHENNENLIRQAFSDPSPPSNHRVDSGERKMKLLQFQNQSVGTQKQQLGEDIHLDDLKRSLHLQEGLYRKVEQEFCEMHVMNMYLDVLSTVLQETVLGAREDAKITKQKMNELEQQLQLSAESKELVMQMLRTATDEVHSLNAKCNDVALQNQILEANLQNMVHENHLFVQKIAEWESLVMLYRGYENRYEACAAENTELTFLLEKKTLEIGILQNNNFSLQDELKAAKIEFDELSSGKENMQSFVNFLQHKLQILISSYDKISSLLPPMSESESQDLQSEDLTGVVARLEELQHNACEKILQLVEENKRVMHERDAVQLTIGVAESEIALMKQKLEHEVRNMADKLDASNMVTQKIQLDMEALANRVETNNKFEEKYTQLHTEFFCDLDRLEVQLQEITSKNMDLAHDISALETVTAAELTKENHALMFSVQAKDEESSKLASELKSLKETLESLHDEKRVLMVCSQDKTEESAQLAKELSSLKESLSSLRGENQALIVSSQDKAAEAVKLALELNSLKGHLQSMDDENQALKIASQDKAEESTKLELEISGLKESLKSLHNDKEALVTLLQDKVEESAKLAVELNLMKESLQSLQVEKQSLMSSLQEKDEASAKLALEINDLKESLQSLHDEKQALVASSQNKMDELTDLTLELNCMKASLESLDDEKKALIASAQNKAEEASKLASEVHRLEESLQALHEENQVLMACSQEKSNEIDAFQSELNSLRESLQFLRNENQALMMSSHDKTDESAQLALELNSLRDSLRSLNNQLHGERSLRESLESKMADQASQLNEKENELLHLQKSVSHLESEKLRVCNLLSNYEESLEVARKACSSVPGLEIEIYEMLELLISTDVRLIFTKTQYEGIAEQMVFQLCSSDRDLAEFQKKYSDTETALNCCLASNTYHIEENEKLLTSLNFVRSELEACITENKSLREANCVTKAELEENRNRDLNVTLHHCEETSQHSLEVESLKLMLVHSEEEIENLVLSNEESEVKVLLLKAKLDEKQGQIIAIQGYRDELKKQYNEISQRLAEQTMKTEEFRNLSIHLKELKDKVEAECVQAHEKSEPEASPGTMQDSLRIAFIKEQYETKLQELKHQLSVSKKHSEEMLWKLQDAIDEIENRKRSEACHLKKNEELGIKILDLEAELQLLLSDKREKMKAYDLMKAEMECSSISLECCKEEKKKLEASLQDCEEEKCRIAGELTQMKELLENSKSILDLEVQNNGSCIDDPLCDEKRSVNGVSTSCSSSYCDEVDQTSILMNVQPKQDHLAANGIRNPTKFSYRDMKQSGLINDHLRAESLMISMDNLSNELERMKNENSLLQDNDLDVKFPNLQSELLQLQKANDELGSMFPLFSEFSGSGNALERVLALEMELAESLQAKKTSSIHFQSSFLKQHSDEEAVFKSFRDINELIKDMLEIKGRYSSVETELKEMHDRYSQLSLQFAEVEGERQKLMMTLKNVRASKKALQLNRSASASLGDHSL